MGKPVPCAACGNLSRKFLFKNDKLGIPICSKKCEYQYLKNLSSTAPEHALIVEYLDRRITEYRKRNRICWAVTVIGVLFLLLGFLVPDVNVFIAGGVIVFVGPVATRHFEDTIRKITIQRKRLAI